MSHAHKNKSLFALLSLALAALLGPVSPADAGETWGGGYASPDDACRSKIDESGAFKFSRPEIHGNVAYCFTIAKEDGKDEYHDTSVLRDEPVEEAKKDEESGSNNSAPPPNGGNAGAPPPAASKDAFSTACIEAYGTTDFETEIDAAYKAKSSPSGNVAVLEWTDSGKPNGSTPPGPIRSKTSWPT